MPHTFKWFRPGRIIVVNDKMQQEYCYRLTALPGQRTEPRFTPQVSPAQMLAWGVFEGHYLNDCQEEFSAEWFARARQKLSPLRPDETKNCFGVKSRLPRGEWLKHGWILPFDPDPRGWFQWYCRYWLGRRLADVDDRQIRRWAAFTRHRAQVIKNCRPGDLTCRKRQRQALLQWAYNPFI